MKKHLFIADNINKWSIENDTTPLIIKELLSRSHEIFTTTPEELSLHGNILKARCINIKIKDNRFIYSDLKLDKIDTFHVIHIRTDPPFNMKYYYQLLLLRYVKKDTKILNSPEGVLKFNEKLSILNFPEMITDTIVTSKIETALDFLKKNKIIVLKSLSECSSRGIKKISLIEKDILIKSFIDLSEPLMIQKYIDEVKKGEVRVTIINGIAVGWMKKIPEKNNFLASLDFGAQVAKHLPTQKEFLMANKIGNHLLKHGIYFAALDIINENLSEINVTSPGLLKEMNQFCPTPLEKLYCDFIFNK